MEEIHQSIRRETRDVSADSIMKDCTLRYVFKIPMSIIGRLVEGLLFSSELRIS